MALHINKRMHLKWKDKGLWIKMNGTCTAGRKYESFLNVQTVGSNLHVCTVHQQYQSTFLLIHLMHTIIKSQEC